MEARRWCRQRSLWDQEWNSIVFSDESRFCLGMHDGRARVRRRRGERRNPLMVWGAIAYGPDHPDLSPIEARTLEALRREELVWCRQRSLWDQEWNSIVFSDESRFCLGMHDGRARVRRRRGERSCHRRNPQFFVERHVHHTVGVMVWGAIAYGSRPPLIFIRGNMNAQRYIHEVLEPHLLPYLDTLADPTFQQDNARPHVARVTIDFFQHNDVTLLP
ncbi:unnamed protein product [Acanthoscelides obtectus]|uniref:Transposase n=1 Tax=Acanthoscelides obtectus TaxID=200917 RepID=A0A9P0PFL1_ACAOB|nr:unnamed protein product [Acanthoscelides obtectus]CAK1677078.1 Transposable element Tc3 transposase [Acanthoscelides obtectus]